jgi:hypothetical protein
MDQSRIEAALKKLGNFSLQFVDTQGGMPGIWQLYNPFVEGDAQCFPFASFEGVIWYLESL